MHKREGRFASVPDDLTRAKLDGERIVRGYLTGVVDSAVLATWTEPEFTPEIIRAITGRFVAALLFRVRFGSNSRDDPTFAQRLYNEAMSMIGDIIAGNTQIPDVVVGTDFNNTWFEPNNASDPPKFTMADTY